MVNLILIGVIMLFLLICIAFGFLRGVIKSRIRCLTVLGAAVVSFIIALILKSSILSDPNALRDGIAKLNLSEETMEVLSAFMQSQALCDGLLGIGTALVIPLLFLAVFAVICLITWIAHIVVTLILRKKIKERDEHMNHKILQIILLNVAQGLIVLLVILVPLNVYAQLAPATIRAVGETGILDDSPEIQAVSHDYFEPLSNSIVKVSQPLCGPLTSFKINGEKVKLNTEVEAVASFVGTAVALGDTGIQEYSESESDLIRSLAGLFDKSVLIPQSMSEIVYYSSDAWLSGQTFGGAARPDMGEMFDPIFVTLLEVLNGDSQKSPAALKADILTTADMASVLAKHDTFSKFDDTDSLVKQLGANGVVSELVEVLGTNESMKIMIPEVTNMGMRAIAMSLDIAANGETIYNDFLNDIANALNSTAHLSQEARVEALSEELKLAFADANVPIENALLGAYATSMIKDLGNAGTVSTNDVADFFTVYSMKVSVGGVATAAAAGKPSFSGSIYGAMSEEMLASSGAATLAKVSLELTAVQGDSEEAISQAAKAIIVREYQALLGNQGPVLELLRNIDLKTALSETVLQNTASMKSAATMKSDTVTENDILIDVDDAAEHLTPDVLAKEGEILETVFREAGTLSDMGSDMNSVDQMANSLAPILDALEQSVSVGSTRTANILIATMQSKKFLSNANIDLATATGIAKKATVDATTGNVDYQNIMNSVSSAVTLGNTMQNGNLSSEEDVEKFVNTLNPTTASMMNDYISEDRMKDYGFSEDKATLSSDLVNNMFDHLAEQEVKSDADVLAVQQMMNVATLSKENTSASDGMFGRDGRLGKSAQDVIEIMVESDSVCHSLDKTLNSDAGVMVDPLGFGEKMPEGSDDRKDFLKEAEDYKAAHAGDAEALARLTLVGALFGVQI